MKNLALHKVVIVEATVSLGSLSIASVALSASLRPPAAANRAPRNLATH